ncbi:flagellar protein FliS [Novosphingobium mangrovi (ex Huang et al. 2023)]|uniref:Flagellar protein FliS n=1 Tax=Novosphingobium mangrovi (ex Huang et al. 2023) TaxID=2976432 RepID=A0ABT2I053_9SPHN|nr:flagellar protein FliS [Novosphingobium mangrovi (ex Huang et al. 2023)]MCT2398184.1 flagellar protein FliS [Novosphingobium mangrovi (ex Huang et al. 2023)]
MLLQQSPHEAYRRVDFDARVNGAKSDELVHVCYEHLVGALGTAIHAQRNGDNDLKSRSMTRALTAITALQMGVSSEHEMSGALNQFYAASRRAILDSAVAFDPNRMATLREDFVEIGQALKGG